MGMVTGVSGVQRQVDASGNILNENGQPIQGSNGALQVQGNTVYSGGVPAYSINSSGQMVAYSAPAPVSMFDNPFQARSTSTPAPTPVAASQPAMTTPTWTKDPNAPFDAVTPGMTYAQLLKEFDAQKAAGTYKGGPLIASDGQHYNVSMPANDEFSGFNQAITFDRGTNNGNNNVSYSPTSPTGNVYKDDDSFGGFLKDIAPIAALGLGAYGLSGLFGGAGTAAGVGAWATPATLAEEMAMLGVGGEAAGAGMLGAGAAAGAGTYADLLAQSQALGLPAVPTATAGFDALAATALPGVAGATWGSAALSDLVPTLAGSAYGSMTLASAAAKPGLLESIVGANAAAKLTELAKSGVVGGALNLAGGLLQADKNKDAAQTTADAQLKAAQIAADAAKFKPVGVTTRFGQSNFGYDANGNLTSAGYTLAPDLKAQQDRLMGTSNQMLSQFTGSQAATAPMGQAAQSAMALGNQYLTTSPQAQAQKYMAEQQALLATGRERDYAALQQRLASQGRLGLATGATSTGMGAANPELEAWNNAKRQQDLELAAKATQGGMDYATYGAGMVGTGGQLLNQMYGSQTAAYAPYQTALGGAQTLEGMGQGAMDIGTSIGAKSSTAAANAGSLIATGMMNSAQTMQKANSQSPWADMLTNAGGLFNQYANPQQTTQQQNWLFNPLTGVKY